MTTTLTVGPGSLVFGSPGSEKAAQITKCSVVPSVEKEDDIPVLSGQTVAGERTYTYVLTGEWLQDITTSGISTWSWTNEGMQLPFVYIPNDATERAISGDVIIDSTTIGGDVKKKALAEFEFSCVGKPAIGDVGP